MSTTKKKTTVKTADLSDIIEEDAFVEKVDLSNMSDGLVRLDDNVLVDVKSNVFGELIYINSKTKDETRWQRCGMLQQLTIGDLRAMKASQVDFFKNQWIIIVGFADGGGEGYTTADIYKALHIIPYYKELIEPSDFDAVCSWSPDEIKNKLAYMSTEAKANLAIALNEYIGKGILDSLKAIKTFEELLGCELKIPE